MFIKNYYTAGIQDRSCGEPDDTALRAANGKAKD
jgi:hypothetical protein